MVAVSDPTPDDAPAEPDMADYLRDMGLQLALLSVSAGRPEAALHFLKAMMAVGSVRHPAENAAPAAAT